MVSFSLFQTFFFSATVVLKKCSLFFVLSGRNGGHEDSKLRNRRRFKKRETEKKRRWNLPLQGSFFFKTIISIELFLKHKLKCLCYKAFQRRQEESSGTPGLTVLLRWDSKKPGKWIPKLVSSKKTVKSQEL